MDRTCLGARATSSVNRSIAIIFGQNRFNCEEVIDIDPDFVDPNRDKTSVFSGAKKGQIL